MEKDELIGGGTASNTTIAPSTLAPTTLTPYPSIAPTANATEAVFDQAEVEHESDAITVLLMNVTLILCLLLAYYVKRNRIYRLPER